MKKIIILILLCTVTGKAFSQFTATLAGYPLVTTGWNIGGDATVVDSTIKLTPSTTNQAGYVYYNTPVNLTTCAQFTVDFDFKIVGGSGGVADGIAFWYISNPPSGFVTGGGIGLPTYPDGLLMILDTYNNDGPADNNPLETLLGYSGTTYGYVEGSTSGVLAPVVSDQYFIDDGSWHHCKITYNSGTIKTYFNYSATPSMTGTYTLSINGYFGFSASTGAVTSTQSVKNVYIDAVGLAGPPAVPATSVTYCQGVIADTLTATPSPGNPIYWYTTDTGTVVALDGNPVPSTSVPGTYWYFVRQGAGSCLSDPDSVEVIVNPSPLPPVITGDTVYCEDSTFIPFSATGTGVLWYTADTGGIGTTTAPIVNTAIPGDYTFYATQTAAGCESQRDSINIIVHNTPATPVRVGGDTVYCQYFPNVPLTVTGTNILWYTTPTGGTGSSTAPVVNTFVPGIYDYYVSQTDSGCESARLHIPVTVFPRPAAPAVTPIIYCQYKTADSLLATGANLTWYGVGVTPGYALSPTPSTAISGTYDYYVTQTVNGCVSDSAELIVVVDSTPVAATITVNTPICAGDTLYFNATSPTAGVTYNWTNSTSTFTSTQQNPVINTAPVSATALYSVTVTLGICSTSTSMPVVVNVVPTFTSASSNMPVCSTNNLVLISNFNPGGGTVNWTGPLGYSAAGATTTVFNTTVTSSGVYSVSETLNGCTSDTGTINIVIDSTPAVPALFTSTVCQGDTLKLSATDQTAGVTYAWQGPAPDNFTSNDQNTYISNAPVSATGLYVVTVTLMTGTVACTNSATISASVTATPFFTPTSNSPLCTGDTLKLYANGAPLSTYVWSGPFAYYAHSLASDPTVPDVTIENAGVYTVTAFLNNCYTSETATVIVNNTPLPPFISWLTYCQYYPAPPLMATGTGIQWYAADSIQSGVIPVPVPSTSVVGSTFYFATQTVNGCTSAIDSIQVTVNPTPVVTVTPTDTAVCPHTPVTLTATDPDVIAYYHWYPALYLSDTNTAVVTANAETDMSYSLVASNQFGCTDTAHTHISIYPSGVISLGDSVTLYPGETYTLSPVTNCTTFSWFPPAGLSNSNISNPVVTAASSTKYIVYGETINGCTAADSVSIYVSAASVISMPNAFTPGNGANSEFKANKKGVVSLNYFRIFDRWGQKMFETTNIDAGWDGTFNGTAQPFGVYVYEIEAVSESGQNFVLHGNVTLLR